VLDNDYVDLVIKELKNLWPECVMVRGSPRHSESNGGVERVNQTVQKKLGGWMKTNNSTHWSIGCKLVQWRINTQVHQTLKDTPYRLTYGMHPRVGLSNLPISNEILSKLVTEAELNDVIAQMQKVEGPALDNEDNRVSSEGADEVVIMTPPRKRPRATQIATTTVRAANHAKRLARSQELPLSPEGGVVLCVPTGKSTESDTPAYNRWLELIDERNEPVAVAEITRARVGTVLPIIYCTNNKDITDDANWAPCILRKIRKEQFEILDTNEVDKIWADLDWNGDDGLANDWGMYYKYPVQGFIDSFRELVEIAQDNKIAYDVSPRRQSLRTNATTNVRKKADTITAKMLTKSPELIFQLGDVVLVPLDDVDRTKVDGANLCGVVVTVNKDKSTCRVAVKQGLLHRAYVYHKLKPVPKASNNLDALDLREAFEDWRSLPKITEREAARFVSSVGGQGIIHCNCRGKCTTNSCACRKTGRLCSSRCHRNNNECKNKQDNE